MDNWADMIFYMFSTLGIVILITTIVHFGYQRVKIRTKQAEAINAIARYLADNSHEINIEAITN